MCYKFTLGQEYGVHKQGFNDGCGSCVGRSLIELTWTSLLLFLLEVGVGLIRELLWVGVYLS